MRFCKLSRQQIAANMEELTQLVAQPEYICESCARVANTQSNLCKGKAFVEEVIEQQSQTVATKTVVVAKPKKNKKAKKLAKAQDKLLKKQAKLEKKLAKVQAAQLAAASKYQQLESIKIQALH